MEEIVTEQTTTDLVAALSQTFDHAHRIISGVEPGQLGNPTPCTEWNVGQLLSHTVGVVANIGNALTGHPAGDPGATVLSSDPARQFRSAADSTLAAWREVGLDGETDIGAGPMPRQDAIGVNLLDTATHSWDIARATGQAEELPPELADLVLHLCRGLLTDEIRSFAGFAPAVDPGPNAGPTDRLVAFQGRRP